MTLPMKRFVETTAQPAPVANDQKREQDVKSNQEDRCRDNECRLRGEWLRIDFHCGAHAADHTPPGWKGETGLAFPVFPGLEVGTRHKFL